ncbi:MAG TPA: zinc ribbon domain-containing protein, partial [Citricoccus sp.]
QDLTAALQEAGVETTPSKFDVVFRRGIDHLSAGQPGGAAQSSLEEALTYYDSALATSHLRQARDLASRDPGASAEPATAAGPQDGTGGIRPGAWVAIILALVLVAGLAGALVLGRRHPAPRHSLAGGDAGRGACSRCGRPLEPASRFCGGCGHPVG